ncbi:MAG: Cytochrome c1 heme lyase [Bogoriella megaspora]|nr:MAG: Cytochrome c1 heme lyase [Bogoriella megaspora]
MANEAEASSSACPVDHKTREAWLEQARSKSKPEPSSALPTAGGQSCDSSQIDNGQSSSSSSWRLPLPGYWQTSLDTEREVSSIPRSSPASPQERSRPANNEYDTGADKSSGNWVYPSEQMFFSAMRRKNYDPRAEDMRSIVPIHNAVNERAWKEIKEWEKGQGAEKCGGPRLESFSGLNHDLTPKARFYSLLGYQKPFDRHDWIVDRCGTKVEYVIDFYAGKDEGKGKSLNFYLDVRPKLNSWEGWRLRAARMFSS